MSTVTQNYNTYKVFHYIRFCTAAADRKLRLFTSDLKDKNEYKVRRRKINYNNNSGF